MYVWSDEEELKKEREEKNQRRLEEEQQRRLEEERKRRLEEERKKAEQLEKVNIERIKKIFRVSRKLGFSAMQKALAMDENTFMIKIFDWADQFGFTIDGSEVIFKQEMKDDFISMLEDQFEQWEGKEKSKEGKV